MRNIDKVLVIGGAGFIGSHTVDLLVQRGYQVTVFDNLEPQVHGKKTKKPDYLNSQAEFIRGDVTNQKELFNALKDADAIFHLAAAVGVGQSMYHIRKYIYINTYGTGNLLDLLANQEHGVKKLVVASSMSIYGEGKFLCETCGPVYPPLRSKEQLAQHVWELNCPSCGKVVRPVPTDEQKPLQPTSIYAMSKRHQEEMCLLTAKVYGIPTVALRYFNVYGPRQSLSNPYTGVCAIFSSRIMAGKPPFIYEDGRQSRDFVYVEDVARANVLALEKSAADYEIFNVGSGNSISILHLANVLIDLYKAEMKPEINNQFRFGDIRHCFADISKIERKLGYKPSWDIKRGLYSLKKWVSHQNKFMDRFETVKRELEIRGLVQ